MRIGILGAGALGGAIARGLLGARAMRPDALELTSRSGTWSGARAHPDVAVGTDAQAMAERSRAVILALPPAAMAGLSLDLSGRLVISVMAGIPASRIAALTGATRVVRAMSSPAAARRLAYSPFWTAPGCEHGDASRVLAILDALGLADRVASEAQIDAFTAMTGPVPGFVAVFAAAMVRFAESRGVEPGIAERAIRQLFIAGADAMLTGRPQDHVRAMLDYAGTTAAGIEAMRAAGLDRAVDTGLAAAEARARALGGG